jgi:hypothetical protein
VDLDVSFLDDLAHPTVVTAKRNPELELAYVPFPKPEGAADFLRVGIGAGKPWQLGALVPLLHAVPIRPVRTHGSSVTGHSPPSAGVR